MEHTKLATGNKRRSSVSRALPQPEKKRDDAARSTGGTTLRKKAGRSTKREKLVCRYCGSADLAPSFIRRRDRRCRKVFRQKVRVSSADQEGDGQEVAATPRDQDHELAPIFIVHQRFRCQSSAASASRKVRPTVPPGAR